MDKDRTYKSSLSNKQTENSSCLVTEQVAGNNHNRYSINKILFLGSFFLTILLLIILLFYILSNFINHSTIITTSTWLISSISISVAIFIILQRAPLFSLGALRRDDDFSTTTDLIDNKLEEFRNTFNPEMVFNEDDKKQILKNLSDKLESDALKSYKNEIHNTITSQIKEDVLEYYFESILKRLSGVIKALDTRSSINLVSGIFIASVGLCILSVSALQLSEKNTIEISLVHYFPRISLVVLIEIFSYFFLRLYKENLSEIKYFQNEILNIEARRLAVFIMIQHNDHSFYNKIAYELCKTERNFVLQKGQSTIEIERDRVSNRINNEFFKIFKKTLEK